MDNPVARAGSQLVAIKRLDVFREALQRIEAHIDTLQPGDRLPSDRDLAAMLGVSRPLVRQALKVLEGLGRVRAQQGSGTYVEDAGHQVAVAELTRGLRVDASLLRDALPVRVAIELEVMRQAFARRTPESLALLREALARRERQLGEGESEGGGLDLSFEATLGRVCGNEMLRRLQALIHGVWLQAEIGAGVAPADPAILHQEHRRLYEAFAGGDLEAAVRAFRAHLSFDT